MAAALEDMTDPFVCAVRAPEQERGGAPAGPGVRAPADLEDMVGVTGLEPVTPCLSSKCSTS